MNNWVNTKTIVAFALGVALSAMVKSALSRARSTAGV